MVNSRFPDPLTIGKSGKSGCGGRCAVGEVHLPAGDMAALAGSSHQWAQAPPGGALPREDAPCIQDPPENCQLAWRVTPWCGRPALCLRSPPASLPEGCPLEAGEGRICLPMGVSVMTNSRIPGSLTIGKSGIWVVAVER